MDCDTSATLHNVPSHKFIHYLFNFGATNHGLLTFLPSVFKTKESTSHLINKEIRNVKF